MRRFGKMSGDGMVCVEPAVVASTRVRQADKPSERPTIEGFATTSDECEPIEDLPLIVFGDHSCTFKYVDFPFVRGADGTQLLKFDSGVFDMRFMCSYLKRMPLPKADKYERHMKYLKALRILVPPFAEQKKLADKIEKIEAKIAAANVLIASAAEKKSAILDKYLK